MSYDKNSSLDHALELAKKRFGKPQIEVEVMHKYNKHKQRKKWCTNIKDDLLQGDAVQLHRL